ncbi:Mitochondrial adenine nucleotide transporter ADNT1 [Platanthera zijinensis]|uniref:Mitochondrial adenine nucleotide transporter ADNT1 n=1 Tax=Platanthera zijinensis TaxID=2320716 RepID=A0AAP0AYX7_9ASPA
MLGSAYPAELAWGSGMVWAGRVSNTGKSSHGLRHLTAQPPYTGIKDVFWSVYKEGGLRSLYRGVGPTLIGILPYAGLKFYIYEELKSRVPEDYKKSVVLRLCCGALAGLFGQTLTYPLDVVRRQMQVQSCQQFDQIGSPRITGAIQGISTIIREQGWKRLFAGLSLNYLKCISIVPPPCRFLKSRSLPSTNAPTTVSASSVVRPTLPRHHSRVSTPPSHHKPWSPCSTPPNNPSTPSFGPLILLLREPTSSFPVNYLQQFPISNCQSTFLTSRCLIHLPPLLSHRHSHIPLHLPSLTTPASPIPGPVHPPAKRPKPIRPWSRPEQWQLSGLCQQSQHGKARGIDAVMRSWPDLIGHRRGPSSSFTWAFPNYFPAIQPSPWTATTTATSVEVRAIVGRQHGRRRGGFRRTRHHEIFGKAWKTLTRSGSFEPDISHNDS